MKWNQAYKHIENGGTIKRKSWLAFDYLYLEQGVVYCDGGFPYTELVSLDKLKKGNWIKSKETRPDTCLCCGLDLIEAEIKNDEKKCFHCLKGNCDLCQNCPCEV